MKLNNLKNYAPILVRVGVSLVFLWFGINQLINPISFLSYFPKWLSIIMINTNIPIILNGIFEIIFGFLLLIGLYTRISSLLLSINLFFIMVGLGYNDIAIRDFGLMLATFSVFLHGPDKWSFDNKKKKRNI
ncbi:MAG: DoxX family protein [Candidatus Nanoarchaeia archaeon]